jgi:flagellar basal-body rod protein FlgB
MGVNFENALGVHGAALRLRAERTRILAANIANVDTPGYQARDIDFSASLREAMAEQAGDGGLVLRTATSQALYRVPNHPSQDGNTVELGTEQAVFAQNAVDFQTTLTFLNMKLRGLAKAIAGQ